MVRIIDYQCTRIDLNRYGIATKACRVAIFFIEMPVKKAGEVVVVGNMILMACAIAWVCGCAVAIPTVNILG